MAHVCAAEPHVRVRAGHLVIRSGDRTGVRVRPVVRASLRRTAWASSLRLQAVLDQLLDERHALVRDLLALGRAEGTAEPGLVQGLLAGVQGLHFWSVRAFLVVCGRSRGTGLAG